MARARRASGAVRLPDGQRGLVILASSAAAAAGVSITQWLLIRRRAERGREGTESAPGIGSETRPDLSPPAESEQVQRNDALPEPVTALDHEPAESPTPEAEVRAAAEELPQADSEVLTPGIKRIYGQGRDAMARVRRKPSDADWLELRRRSKDLRYATALLEPARPKRSAKVSEQADRVSRLLDEAHELALLSERVKQGTLDEDDVRVLTRLVYRQRSRLQRKARRAAERLYRRKPRQFMRRLGLD